MLKVVGSSPAHRFCHLWQNIIIKGDINMNKTELVAAIAEKAQITRKDADAALKAFTDVVSDELKKGEKIQLVGFGTFEVSERPAREGRNPRTGETMTIAASKQPKFKPGKALKDAIN
jgi:DNA-binding protein HU-beta